MKSPLSSFMETQQEIDQLAAAIYRDKVLRARAMSPEERFMAGFQLFEESLTFTKAGIAAQLGTADESAILAEIRRRFDIVRKREDIGYFEPLASSDLSEAA